MSGGVKQLYEYIKINPGQRTNNLAVALNLSADTVDKCLRKLKKENKIEFCGPDKTGGYFIK